MEEGLILLHSEYDVYETPLLSAKTIGAICYRASFVIAYFKQSKLLSDM